DFLQIPPRDGHPCPLLTVPTAKPVTDFHRQVIAHAEHTRTSDAYVSTGITLVCYEYFDF
ncbi:MAG: hypothetical protein LBN34_03925, partial [Clostridiales Family XIII bacterium]|nr:hypothetical protein [Clostridiales Family XIII bacterium]